jgi:uncharacterized protein
MLFRPLASPCSARWRPVEGEGLEHLTIRPSDGGCLVRSAVVGSFEGRAYGAFYSAVIDSGWRTLSFRVQACDGRRLALSSPEPGRWTDEEGFAREDLNGCIDIDLSATPFTNTLPIRRLGLSRADGEVALTMLYVPFDTLDPFPDIQFYRAIEDGRLYRFENDDRSFAADLPLDEDGLVLDYPTLFNRL